MRHEVALGAADYTESSSAYGFVPRVPTRREASGLSNDRYGQFSGIILHYSHSGHFNRSCCVTTYKISSYNSKLDALCV